MNDVMDAVNRGDFTDLGKNIQNRVNDAVKQATDQTKRTYDVNDPDYLKHYGINNSGTTNKGQTNLNRNNTQSSFNSWSGGESGTFLDELLTRAGRATVNGIRNSKNQVNTAWSTMVSVIKMVVGASGTLFNGSILLMAIFDGPDDLLATLFLIAMFLILTVVFGLLFKSGMDQNRIVKDAAAFQNVLRGKEYITIESLAATLGLPEKRVRKEVRKMLRKGMIQGRLDASEQTLIMTEKAYQQYVETMQNQREKEVQQRKEAEEKAAKEKEEAKNASKKKAAGAKEDPYAGFSEDVASILKDGSSYIKQVREINDEIPDTEEMSNKLYRLEDTMNRIFDAVRKDPDKAKDLRRFMNYYIPTTMKLLTTYVELCQHGDGENVSSSKWEIEQATDTINDAFDKILDDMFEDTTWDVSSDIDVLKTMMAQDGLTSEKEEEKEKVPVE